MYKYLKTYRCNPRTSTQLTPYRLQFGREPGTKPPKLPHQSPNPNDEVAYARDTKFKATMKKHADQWARTSELHLSEQGRALWLQNATRSAVNNRSSTDFQHIPACPGWTSCRSCDQNPTFRYLPKPLSKNPEVTHE